jgi:hypothetical protein
MVEVAPVATNLNQGAACAVASRQRQKEILSAAMIPRFRDGDVSVLEITFRVWEENRIYVWRLMPVFDSLL